MCEEVGGWMGGERRVERMADELIETCELCCTGEMSR
jgi:hypothetical protein